jgi:hypothetical protein
VLHLRRTRQGERRVAEIGLLERAGDELVVAPIWSCARGAERRVGALIERLADRGVDPGGLLC